MIYILVPVLAVLMLMVVVSLVRGLGAFRENLDTDPDGTGATESQLRQNRMMWARIKYQAIAIGVVVVLLGAVN